MLSAGLILILILIDQASKAWALSALNETNGYAIPVINGIVRFQFAWNAGAAFSFLKDAPYIVFALSAVVLFLVALIVFLSRTLNAKTRLCLSMVFAGGLGNLIDRVRFQAVVDFIKLEFISFPVFNFADICVTVGALLLILCVYIPSGRGME